MNVTENIISDLYVSAFFHVLCRSSLMVTNVTYNHSFMGLMGHYCLFMSILSVMTDQYWFHILNILTKLEVDGNEYITPLKEKMKLKLLHSGAISMYTGWPPFRDCCTFPYLKPTFIISLSAYVTLMLLSDDEVHILHERFPFVHFFSRLKVPMAPEWIGTQKSILIALAEC